MKCDGDGTFDTYKIFEHCAAQNKLVSIKKLLNFITLGFFFAKILKTVL